MVVTTQVVVTTQLVIVATPLTRLTTLVVTVITAATATTVVATTITEHRTQLTVSCVSGKQFSFTTLVLLVVITTHRWY